MKKTVFCFCLGFFLTAAFAWFNFFPRLVFRDCVRAVFPDGRQEESGLLEEDYADLFHPKSSDYKVTWKFF